MSNLTSNGQVTSRDIRQGAVKTLHVVDDAITTPKIPDLAITFPDKIDDPIWVTSFESNPGLNPTLTTSFQEVASIDVSVPAWVDAVEVFAAGQWLIQNTSGGAVDFDVSTRVNDSDDGARRQTVANNSTGTLTHFEDSSLIGVAGSSFEVSVYVKVSTGTNTVNNGAVWGIAIGTR